MNQNFTNRVRLLMEYDTSTTESENNDRIFKKNVLSLLFYYIYLK